MNANSSVSGVDEARVKSKKDGNSLFRLLWATVHKLGQITQFYLMLVQLYAQSQASTLRKYAHLWHLYKSGQRHDGTRKENMAHKQV